MWFKQFKDYPIDSSLKKERKEPGKGFNGCEMHELNGWGESFAREKPAHKEGFIKKFIKKWLP